MLRIALPLLATITLLLGCRSAADYFLGAARISSVPLDPGRPVVVPRSDDGPFAGPPPHVDGLISGSSWIVEQWAARDLPNWKEQAKVTAPRVVMAKLTARRDIAEVNRYLQAASPTAGSGSSWPLRPQADYDFTEVTLTTILYLFGDSPDLLHPQTVRHLVHVLLIEEGQRPRPRVPGSFGLITDTENHHLMTEGSRYLKNQWLHRRGSTDPAHDNQAGGLEAWLIAYLETMVSEGPYEFNSMPYLGYTAQALLNLEAFPDSPRIRSLARRVLDTMNLEYALGSLDLRRFAPFRRQVSRADETSLRANAHTALMGVWAGGADGDDWKLEKNLHHALPAALSRYRPPAWVQALALSKAASCLARIGRGPGASPEVYSGGPGYLLSAGGVHRGARSMIAARPTVLMLSDGADDLSRCFYLKARGDYRRWNNTGVHAFLAMGDAGVHVPEEYRPLACRDGWAVYRSAGAGGPLIVVYDTQDLGVIAVLPLDEAALATSEPAVVIDAFARANPQLAGPSGRFVWPDGAPAQGELAFELDAPKGTWLIAAASGRKVPRDYDAWPRLWVQPPEAIGAPTAP